MLGTFREFLLKLNKYPGETKGHVDVTEHEESKYTFCILRW
jgi:hypothetical protein